MELCDDCRRIKVAKVLKGMQKFDKHVLTSHNKRFSHGFLDYLSLAGKSTFALLDWMSWWIHGPGPIRRSRAWRNGGDGPLGYATGVIVAKLGSRLRQSPLKNCDFCNLLAKIRIPDDERSMTYDGDVLVACRYFKDPGSWQKWDHEGTPSDIVIMAVLSEYQWNSHLGTATFNLSMDRSESRGFLTCRPKDSKSDVPQSAQAPQLAIDFGEISRLIQDCHHSYSHRDCQNKTTTSWRPIAICLVDCHSRELVQTTSSESYVALSYVWGGVSAGTLDSGTLPRTLEDAIQVTRSLGFKYIWIDQFCVNQNDSAMKHEQIRTMGMVYADAAVTLVAASGSDSNYGLPGAPNHLIASRHSVVMDGYVISEEAVPIDVGIQDSVWASRGWTFQEQFFSQRFLVFSLGQVSYECRRVKYSPRYGTFRHWTGGPSEDRRPAWKSLWSGLNDRTIGISDYSSMLSTYRYHVAQYWPRQLSLDTDGINAFAAILEHLKTSWDADPLQKLKEDNIGEHKITFTAGMPHLLRHNAESPDPDLGVFVQGLLWYCDSPMKRRRGFPSWCWAGWVPLETNARIRWIDIILKWTPSIRNVFFRSISASESSGGPRHHISTLQWVPIADHRFSSIPEAVILDVPIIPPSAVSWPGGNYEPSVWGQHTSWKLADASVLKRDKLFSNLANKVHSLVALRHQEQRVDYSNQREVALLLVRQVDQYRYERIGIAVTWLDDVSWAQWNRDLELMTLELI